ncbi:MAG: Nif3-like dinuclear metal center hexameric protein [Deltaproteobacteria bacterium]|nr:MAG: Nif3-like dinuclear metal center hexameric protein [Deltaproteobacteria bacterium]
MGEVSGRELAAWGNALLDAQAFRDWAPHGLQIEGDRPIRRVVSGVSANAALIEAAMERGADALLVHHGFFWDREPRALVGHRGARVRAMVRAGMALLAWHLPLDAHGELGNNVLLLRDAGAEPVRPFGDASPPIAWLGEMAPTPVGEVLGRLEGALGQAPVAFVHGPDEVRRVAVCSGGGAGFLEAALAEGADLFVSGEPSEQSQGVAREEGITFAAFGHHATERGGVRALGERMAVEFGLEVEFVDVPNPV